MFEINDDYIKETNSAYWQEENEMKLGIHPIQVRERIEKKLLSDNIDFNDITFLDWIIEGPMVKVWLDNKYYGIFDYKLNIFKPNNAGILDHKARINGIIINNKTRDIKRVLIEKGVL